MHEYHFSEKDNINIKYLDGIANFPCAFNTVIVTEVRKPLKGTKLRILLLKINNIGKRPDVL